MGSCPSGELSLRKMSYWGIVLEEDVLLYLWGVVLLGKLSLWEIS